jgi:lantibiotic modifying enzyme
MTVEMPATDRLLAAANRIAAGLCDAAIWSGDRRSCVWRGETLVFGNGKKRHIEIAEVGGSLYSGTAGIALFLAEIAALTGNSRFAETANAAGRHAHQNVPGDHGLFSGTTGVAWSLLRLNECLGNAGGRHWQDTLAPLLQQADLPASGKKMDVIHGLAGMILGLLSIHRRIPESAILDCATRFGQAICERADWTEDYCNWMPDGPESLVDKPLSGFSHGTSGIGAALLALFSRTGVDEFRLTGRGAFAYDDIMLDREHLTWPDQRKEAMIPLDCETWCYGAPGILMARIIAATSDPAYRMQHEYQAGIAADSTRRSLLNVWLQPGQDSCICHGALGACEGLIVAGQHGLGQSFSATGIEGAVELVRRTSTEGDWKFRIRSPELLVGVAGVGHALLRIAHPDRVESVLMVR